MAIRTVGDLLNLPQAFEARMQQKEFESQQRASEAVAKLFGKPTIRMVCMAVMNLVQEVILPILTHN